MIGNSFSSVAKKQHYPPLANSPHRPAWAFQTTHGIPVKGYIPGAGAPTYLGRPQMGSFPVCPPYNPAYLASAPSGAYIIPPYPAFNSYEHTLYSSPGSSHAPSTDLQSPAAGTHPRPKPQPKTFEITIPNTSRSVKVMFVERVVHLTAPVEYGIVPVDPDERAELKACYNMEVLNTTPRDRIAFRTFFVDDKWIKGGRDSILGQLLSLGIVEPVKRVHYEPRGEVGVKVLLREEEIAHACQNPSHKNAVFESPEKTRFGVCSGCNRVRSRRLVYYCDRECQMASLYLHRIDCSQTRLYLEPLARDVETFLTSPELPRGIVSTHNHNQYEQIALNQQRWLEDVLPRLDMSVWRKNIKERKSRRFTDLLPGY